MTNCVLSHSLMLWFARFIQNTIIIILVINTISLIIINYWNFKIQFSEN